MGRSCCFAFIAPNKFGSYGDTALLSFLENPHSPAVWNPIARLDVQNGCYADIEHFGYVFGSAELVDDGFNCGKHIPIMFTTREDCQ